MGTRRQDLSSQIDGARTLFTTSFARVIGAVTIFYEGDQIQTFTEPSSTTIQLTFAPPIGTRLYCEYETDLTNDGRVAGFSTDPSGVPAVQAGDLQAQLDTLNARITALENSGAPPAATGGPAGGVLAGTFPNPSFANTAKLPPIGAAGGALAGTYPNPTIASGVIPTSLPPNGAAGGGLAGTYPNPTINPAALPTSLPPSGPAGGDLEGNFPNPRVRTAVLPTVPNSLPPSGPAGGALSGSYPNPTINPAALPTSLPPSGPAGGDFEGTYPAPQMRRGSAVAGDVMTLLTNGTWGPKAPTNGGGGGGAPTGPASGDLSGTYPSPAVATVGGVAAASIAANLPSSSEKAGLAGTSGTPSGGNKFVTDADSRNTNSRAPSGAASGDLSGTFPGPAVATVGGKSAATIAANLPSVAEKAAFVGTNGTPGGGNPFVTDSDPRLAGGGGGTIAGQLLLTGVISPTILGSDQADYNPTGLSGASTIRLSSSLGVTISGIVGGAEGRVLVLHNVGSNLITLANNDTASTAANRFLLGTSGVELQHDQSITLRYDATTARWRPVTRDRLVERVMLFLGANQSIPNGGSATAISWGPSSVEAYRVGINHDPNANPDRFTIVTPGVYTAWMYGLLTRVDSLAFSYSITLLTASGSVRAVSTNCGLLSSTALADSFNPEGNVSLTFQCNAGDYFVFSVYQKDPGGLPNNLRGNASPGYTMCSVVRNQ